MVKCLFLLLGAALVSGCASKTYVDYHSFRSIGLQQDLAGLESAGAVLSEDCSFSIFGKTVGGEPSLESAIENAAASKEAREPASQTAAPGSQKIRMLMNVHTWSEGWTAFVVGRQCLKLTAIGYR